MYCLVGEGIQSNDQLHLFHGEVCYSLLRVTNALGFQYMLRSDGITIHDQPLVPGFVYDGDVIGYDLDVINSKSTVTCNWKGFGTAESRTVENVLTGIVSQIKHIMAFVINCQVVKTYFFKKLHIDSFICRKFSRSPATAIIKDLTPPFVPHYWRIIS